MIRLKVKSWSTFTLGVGLAKTNPEPEMRSINSGRPGASRADQTIRSDLYWTPGCDERSEAIWRSSEARLGSAEADLRNDEIVWVVDKISPGVESVISSPENSLAVLSYWMKLLKWQCYAWLEGFSVITLRGKYWALCWAHKMLE